MTARAGWQAAMEWLRRIAGMPDYEAYRVHMQKEHPDRVLLTRREHFEEFVEQRYSGISRCC